MRQLEGFTAGLLVVKSAIDGKPFPMANVTLVAAEPASDTPPERFDFTATPEALRELAKDFLDVADQADGFLGDLTGRPEDE